VREEEIRPGQIVRLGRSSCASTLIEPPAPLDDAEVMARGHEPGYWGKIRRVGNASTVGVSRC